MWYSRKMTVGLIAAVATAIGTHSLVASDPGSVGFRHQAKAKASAGVFDRAGTASAFAGAFASASAETATNAPANASASAAAYASGFASATARASSIAAPPAARMPGWVCKELHFSIPLLVPQAFEQGTGCEPPTLTFIPLFSFWPLWWLPCPVPPACALPEPKDGDCVKGEGWLRMEELSQSAGCDGKIVIRRRAWIRDGVPGSELTVENREESPEAKAPQTGPAEPTKAPAASVLRKPESAPSEAKQAAPAEQAAPDGSRQAAPAAVVPPAPEPSVGK